MTLSLRDLCQRRLRPSSPTRQESSSSFLHLLVIMTWTLHCHEETVIRAKIIFPISKPPTPGKILTSHKSSSQVPTHLMVNPHMTHKGLCGDCDLGLHVQFKRLIKCYTCNTTILYFMVVAAACNMTSVSTLLKKNHSFLHCCDPGSHIRRYITIFPCLVWLSYL